MRNLKNIKKSDRGFVGWIIQHHDTPERRYHGHVMLDHPLGQGEWIRGHREDGLNTIYESCPWPRPFCWIVSAAYGGFADGKYVHYDMTPNRKGWAVIGHIEWGDDLAHRDFVPTPYSTLGTDRQVYPHSTFKRCTFCELTHPVDDFIERGVDLGEWQDWGFQTKEWKRDLREMGDKYDIDICKTCSRELDQLRELFLECDKIIRETEGIRFDKEANKAGIDSAVVDQDDARPAHDHVTNP